ncbi:hypothetical protein, partial [uncultured Varibaculum sp.]|uniref:hypothetical protein n=1 Tax=uncultured Varibaculum sp. TaxID=413896 RepID=UPI0025955500
KRQAKPAYTGKHLGYLYLFTHHAPACALACTCIEAELLLLTHLYYLLISIIDQVLQPVKIKIIN